MGWLVQALLLATAASPPAATPMLRVAVMEIRALDAPSKGQVEILQEVILTDLSRLRRFEVVGKSDIEAMLGLERQKSLLGCSDESTASCLAELGGALGADYVLIGTVARIDQTRRVDLKLLDTKKNRVVSREFASGATDSEVLEQTRQSLMQLISVIPGGSGALAAPRGPSLPWGAIATTLGGAAVAVTGGAVAAMTTAQFYENRSTLVITEARGMEGAKNLGLAGLAVGLAVTGLGVWMWLSPAPRTGVAIVPVPGGVAVALGGAL